MMICMRILVFLLCCYLACGPAWAEENANDDPVKSWTREGQAQGSEAQFLDGLRWHSRTVGPYILRLGYIQQWIAGLQLLKRDGTVVLSEITPVQEYITIVDAETGKPSRGARDVNHDKVTEIAFLHQKLYDPNYHMYTVYALTEPKPKLLWKSGGKLGDWLHEAQ